MGHTTVVEWGDSCVPLKQETMWRGAHQLDSALQVRDQRRDHPQADHAIEVRLDPRCGVRQHPADLGEQLAPGSTARGTLRVAAGRCTSCQDLDDRLREARHRQELAHLSGTA